MTEQYERSKAVRAPADHVFAWVVEIGNLPRYLPPVKEAGKAGPSGGPTDERVWMRGEMPDRGPFEGEGYFRVFEEDRHNSGRLQVADLQDGTSEVRVQLYFGERSVEGEREESGEGRRSARGGDRRHAGIHTASDLGRLRQGGAAAGDGLSPPYRAGATIGASLGRVIRREA